MNKNNIKNLFSQGSLSVDGDTGKLKFSINQQNEIIVPVFGEGVRLVDETGGIPEFSENLVQGEYKPGVVPTGTLYIDDLDTGSAIVHQSTGSIVDFQLLMRSGSNMSDKNAEIVSRFMGLRPNDADFE